MSTFNIAKQWKQTKESNPEALKMPMRATLFQNIMLTVAARLEALLDSPETVKKARNLGWLDADNNLQPMMWDTTAKIHKPMPGKTATANVAGAGNHGIHAHGDTPLPWHTATGSGISSSINYNDVRDGAANPRRCPKRGNTWTSCATMPYGFPQDATSGTNACKDRLWPTGSAKLCRSCQAPSCSLTSATQPF